MCQLVKLLYIYISLKCYLKNVSVVQFTFSYLKDLLDSN